MDKRKLIYLVSGVLAVLVLVGAAVYLQYQKSCQRKFSISSESAKVGLSLTNCKAVTGFEKEFNLFGDKSIYISLSESDGRWVTAKQISFIYEPSGQRIPVTGWRGKPYLTYDSNENNGKVVVYFNLAEASPKISETEAVREINQGVVKLMYRITHFAPLNYNANEIDQILQHVPASSYFIDVTKFQ